MKQLLKPQHTIEVKQGTARSQPESKPASLAPLTVRSACGVRAVPPSPEVMAHLYAEYLRYRGKKKLSFAQYLKKIGFTDPAAGLKGADKGTKPKPAPGLELVMVPSRKVSGTLHIIVLLADFADNKGTRSAGEYEDMLFSKGVFQTGSMRDFYAEASCDKVDVVGSVHGWFRMPHTYSYYIGARSGMGSYPRNAQRLAEDVLAAALKTKVPFMTDLDKFGSGAITGLFIVHAGQGAEAMTSIAAQANAIWSHKAELQKPVKVTGTLSATNYLTVPEDCRVGVCAHELGHLAFGWDDFYDPNYDEDGSEWDGSGVWDLMAGGTWNGGGSTPAHPAGLHKSQHQWVDVQEIATTANGVVIPPYDKTSGKVVKIKSPQFTDTQCLILENRRRKGFDKALPGEGLLVWRVDTKMEMVNPDRPAMCLVQADGRHSLEKPDDGDEGDAGDPFPGTANKTEVGGMGDMSTSFPNATSGVMLKNIAVDAASGSVKLDVVIS
jgi:immune inhibitor A